MNKRLTQAVGLWSFDNQDIIGMDMLGAAIATQARKWNSEKYYFDEVEARRFYKFSRKLKLDKGMKNTIVQLLWFQFRICTDILCVKRRADRLRKHREAHINIPRKNGKSFIIALILTYLYFFRTEYGAEYIITANTSQQAGLLYNSIVHFIKGTPLQKRCKITDSQRKIYRKDENSYLRVLSSDAKNADSYADLVFCMDEIHEAGDQKLYDKLKTGQGIFNEPLGITITTASSGDNPLNLEMEIYSYAKSIEHGEHQDDSFYYAIFEADAGCDILDREQWYKANPALGVFRKLEDLANMALRATKSKTRELSFRRYFLNQHVSSEIRNAIDMILWQQATRKVDYNLIRNLPNWAGLDLSASQDITAFVQAFYDDEQDKYIIYPHLFTPLGTLQERKERDKVPYDIWVKESHILGLKGQFINFNQLHGFIKNTDQVKELYFDRWGSPATQSALEEDFTLIGFGQGFRSMTPIIREFENLLIEGRLIIAENSAFEFMAHNVVAVLDDAGNIKYSKGKSKNKIDGIIAMLMGLQGAINAQHGNDFDINSSVDDYLNMFLRG
jgi:phage terminase large subunit-like protein